MIGAGRSIGLSSRFLIAGGYNTLFGYIAFVVVKAWLPDGVHYLLVLGVSFVVSVTHAFTVQKYFVFRTRGGFLSEYVRFIVVNLNALLVNAVVLAALVELSIDVLLAQAISTLLTTLLSYIGHRKFTFRV